MTAAAAAVEPPVVVTCVDRAIYAEEETSFLDLVDDPAAVSLPPLPEVVACREPANEVDDDPFVEEPLPTLVLLRRRGTKTLANAHLRKDERRAGELAVYPDIERPRHRGDCEGGQRPCPWVSCRWHLYLEVEPGSGSLKVNFPEREPWELQETCALDVADRGGLTLERVAELTDLTRERVRQVEFKALARARQRNPGAGEYLDEAKQTTGLGQSPWMTGEGV